MAAFFMRRRLMTSLASIQNDCRSMESSIDSSSRSSFGASEASFDLSIKASSRRCRAPESRGPIAVGEGEAGWLGRV